MKKSQVTQISLKKNENGQYELCLTFLIDDSPLTSSDLFLTEENKDKKQGKCLKYKIGTSGEVETPPTSQSIRLRNDENGKIGIMIHIEKEDTDGKTKVVIEDHIVDAEGGVGGGRL